MQFEQHYATHHTAYAKTNILREKFEGMVILSAGYVNWLLLEVFLLIHRP